MKRVVLVLMLVVAIIIPYAISAHAYDEDQHDEYMEGVLFGDSKPQNEEALKMLEAASYLAIDQFSDAAHGNKGQIDLDYLAKQWISGIPKNISEIDFQGNQHHRSNTHRGWDYTLYKNYPNDIAHWKTRKNILLATINKVFNFRFLSGTWLGLDLGYDERCNSFSAMIYYIHILGDHIADEEKRSASGSSDYKATDIMMPLARDNPGDDNPDIIWELQKHFKILFSFQKDSITYKGLMQDMDVLREKAGASSGTTAGLSSNAYAEELMDILESYVPILLKKEDFFLNVFYSDRAAD